MQMKSNESYLIESEFDKLNGTSGNGLDVIFFLMKVYLHPYNFFCNQYI